MIQSYSTLRSSSTRRYRSWMLAPMVSTRSSRIDGVSLYPESTVRSTWLDVSEEQHTIAWLHELQQSIEGEVRLGAAVHAAQVASLGCVV